ncbi:hypothetical protein AB0H71_13790 [Nocardia sp. NPDC050697]|uniref:hypothetical protein n=1 Tax=Nocardia sp. NPDC050697 TaxID=3155158 RepID=UPI0033E11962
MTDRTPEQIAADEALTEAIQNAWLAYAPNSDFGVLMEYVVLARRRTFAEDGEPLTANIMIPRDQDVPIDLLIGMTGQAEAIFRHRAVSWAVGDDD